MSPDVSRRRFLVLTPALDGADGISELSRQVVAALVQDLGPERVDVWAFEGGLRLPPGCAGRPSFRSAARRRLRIARWAVVRAATPRDALSVIVMHAHLSPLAAPLAWRGADVSVFLIGIEVWTRLRPRERRAIEQADRVIAISRYTAQRFRDANPALAARPIVVCHLGIGPDPAGAPPQASEPAFALIVGRMSAQERYKGHDRLIDIWPTIRARVPDAQLVVAGDGDDRDRLQARAAGAALGGCIRFVGQVDDAALAALYRSSAFFVMPSTSEGFGLAYLEAMRAGKPCVALHGSADEIIEHAVSGFVVDEPALADAVVRLFQDRALRERLGAAAAARVAAHFTSAHFARRFRTAVGLSDVDAPLGLPCTSSV